MSQTKSHRIIALLLATSVLGGCTRTLDKIEDIGQPPKMAEVKDPTVDSQYKPMSWPMPETPPPPRQYANSLWQPGARAFFRDQRAARVGDILKVNIAINDKVQVNNETERKRDAADTAAMPSLFGLEGKLLKPLPGVADPADLVDATGSTASKGKGTVKRQDLIQTQVAALITQVLPNGNLVIDGKQELLINYDIREVSVKGVVRPQDIKSDNTIDSQQIAEARIVYSGHGQLMDVQQPRWGAQVVETLSPF